MWSNTQVCYPFYSFILCTAAIQNRRMAKHPSMVDICDYVRTIPEAIAFARMHNILRHEMQCSNCSEIMHLISRNKRVCSDGEAWRCSKCNKTKSIRENSFWQVCLSYTHVIFLNIFMHMFRIDYSNV